MQQMNYAVDGEKRAPAEVVRDFLDTIDKLYVQPR
jgi:glycine betaine/choline ABC-type transport system substrate-binding protein